jgi:hypothetical protein
MKLAILTLPLAVSLATVSVSAQMLGLDLHASKEADCGPIALRAQMVDASDMSIPSQRVKITLMNLASKPIVLERFTVHFLNNTPASQDRFGTETRLEVGPRQETAFSESTTVADPISYVAFDSVKYADGSSWQPSADAACRVVPDKLKN